MYSDRCLNCFLVVVCLLTGARQSKCQSINDTYRLLKDKLANYDRTIRPTSDQSEATVVSFNFSLMFLQELDDVNQRLTVGGTLGLHWVDDVMKWDPAQYGYLTHFLTESGRFWTPNLVLSNNAENVDKIGDEWQTIRYAADGGAYYHPIEMFTVSCSVDVTFYPWDSHFCVLSFTPQSYFPTELQLIEASNKVDMTYYTPNGEWEYVDSFIESDTSTYYSVVNVYFIFDRKPLFVIVNLLVPIILMAFLSVTVFLIPPDCGERISYTITMLLAIAVFLTLVGDNLPKMYPIPIFSYYLITMLATNICITMLTIFNLRLYHTDAREPVSGCWARLATCCKPKKRITNASSRSSQNVSSSSVYITEEMRKPNTFGQINEQRVNNRVPTTVTTATNESDCQKQIDADDITWQDVSAVVDKIFFCFFCIIFIVATVTYLVVTLDSERATIQDVLTYVSDYV